METARWRLYMFPVFMCLIPSSFSVCGWGVFANLRKWYRFAFAVTFLDGLQSECFLLCPTTCFWFIHNVWSKLIPLVAAVAADKRRMMHCCSPGNVQFGQVAPCPWILNSPFVHGIRIWFFCGCKAVWSCQISFLKWENIQPGRRNGEVTPSESMQGLRLIWSDPSSSGQWQQPADFETAISLPACLGASDSSSWSFDPQGRYLHHSLVAAKRKKTPENERSDAPLMYACFALRCERKLQRTEAFVFYSAGV